MGTSNLAPRGDPLLESRVLGEPTPSPSGRRELLAFPRSDGLSCLSTTAREPAHAARYGTPCSLASLRTVALAIGDDYGCVRFWIRARKSKKAMTLSESSPVALTHPRDDVAVAVRNGRTQSSTVRRASSWTTPGATRSASTIDVQPDGSLLAAAGLDRTVALWRLDGSERS